MEQTAPKKGGALRVVLPIVVTVLFGAAYYYLALPALNLQSREFWAFLGILLVVWLLCALLTSGVMRMDRGDVRVQGKLKGLRFRIPLIALGVIVLFNIIGGIVSAPIFHAQSYYELLDVQTGDFASDVAEISYSEIPMLDRDSSVQLGKRALGSIGATSNLVSQFEVADYEYSQINYQGEPVRVAPLEYGNLIKWFNNRADGLPAYIVVNMVTQEARLVRLEEGMKISNSEHFGRNLYRVLRFRYPTMMFGDVNFEIDEDGTPWWICSRIVKTIGIFGGTDIHGAVLVNAVTGESAYYEDVPTWVDRVYNADLVVEQYNYHGTLVNGWVNSWLGQKGITTTTEGYNYIAQNDDVYLYTGVTSAGEDESNVGFILVNQRTKEARYYNITGAEEYSAMSSAQGAVQHLHYTATFPILLNISNEPTYFMALKDSAELVKMYAMVNVADYQITATGASVEACQRNYEALLAENGIQVTDPVIPADQDTVSGTLADLRSVVVEGTTLFYLTMEDGRSYVLSAASCPEAVLLNPGDRVTITFELGEGDILTAVSVAKE